MTFNPNNKMRIDAEGGSFYVSCPFWANDLLAAVPSKRWTKSKRAWAVKAFKMNTEAVRQLAAMAGVETTEAAKQLMGRVEEQAIAAVTGNAFPPWYKFKTQPLKHQREALEKGYGRRAFALFMDMQTGKSKTAIDLCVAHRIEGHIDSVLIIVKRTLRHNWLEQLEIHCPIPYDAILPEVGKARDFEKWLHRRHDFKVMIVGWESLSAGGMAALCERFVTTMPKPAIIGDETTYITNHKSTRTEVTCKLGRRAEYRYALTGTPATEGPLNLFAQFEFLDPNIIGLGDFYAFRNRYCIMGGYQHEVRPGKKIATEVIGYQNMEELMGMVAPYIFQVTKTEAYDLPPKRYEKRTVDITKEQRALIKEVKDGVLKSGDDEMVLNTVLTVMLRAHQIVGGYSVKPREKRWIGRDKMEKFKLEYDPVELIKPESNPKMIELLDVVREFKGRKQGLVWAVYQPEIEAISKLLRAEGLRIGELHGGVPDAERQPMVNAFAKGDLDIIVGNASTGGMGYTMMASEINVFYNNTHKAIDRLQAEDRAWGHGQTKPGIWVDIVAERTIDVTILKALESKMDLQDYVKHRIREINKLIDGDVR